MAPLIPRIHFYEIDDQPWFPSFLRTRVQACLTLFWTFRFPFLQPSSPAALVSRTLHRLLGARVANYTYVDFCAGAGGPTPSIEAELNARLAAQSQLKPNSPRTRATRSSSSYSSSSAAAGPQAVDFVLTDIAPHLTAWREASRRSPHVHFVAQPVDASAAPADLLSARAVTHSALGSAREAAARLAARPPLRLFFLAFHHFEDPLARAILADTLRSAGGFGVFELQDRSLGGLLMVVLLGPLLWLLAPFYFWRDPVMLFWVYVVPVVPFVVVFDGLVSCLRSRTGEEVRALVEECGVSTEGWRFRDGTETHTWPIGEMGWFVGVRE